MLEMISENYKSRGEVLKVEKGRGYSINSQNYIVYFSNGEKAICKYLPKADIGSLAGLLSITKFCEKNGAKVPIILKSDSGKLINRYKTGAFYLTFFSDGEFFHGSIKEIKDFAKEIAVLHKQLKKCQIEYEAPVSADKYKHLSPKEIDSVDSKIKEKDEPSDFDRYVMENIEFLQRHYEHGRNKKEEINKNEISLQYIHYDLHPGNVLFNDGKTGVILDLNSIRKGELVRDIAFACYRFAVYKTNNKDEIRKRRDAFLDSYLKKNQLTEEEKNNLQYYFINECLNRISYILREHYFENDTTWSFDLKKHINNIKTIEGL